MAKSNTAKMVKSKDSKPMTMMIVAAVFLALGLVATNYFTRSLAFHQNVFSKKGEVLAQLESNKTALKELSSAFETNEKTGPTSDAVFAALPTSKDFPQTSSTLESIIQRSGVELNNISISNEDFNTESTDYAVPSPGVEQMSLTVDLAGSYEDVQKMLVNIEKSQRVFRVESIDLSGRSNRVNGLLTITTFYQPAVDNAITTEVITP